MVLRRSKKSPMVLPGLKAMPMKSRRSRSTLAYLTRLAPMSTLQIASQASVTVVLTASSSCISGGTARRMAVSAVRLSR
jgi:hypothetical protein